ncbi:MAG: hypothetical protein WDA20_11625 [Desulfuromonadales bacterium]|jgi:hypothetical protein
MMARTLPLLPILLVSLLFAGGCSDDNSDAPVVDAAHPSGWLFIHGEEARDELTGCRTCHGAELRGAAEAVSCFLCHFDEGAPGFAADFDTLGVHPASWDNVIVDHQSFYENFSWTTCATAACHGANLQSGTFGPSCFVAGCHSQGPPAPPSHDAAPFFAPENHGAVARDNLFACRNCHGRPPFSFDGGYVADPQITNNPIGNCSLAFCHPTAMAHPADWLQVAGGPVGIDDRAPGYFAHHREIAPTAVDNGCSLCHQIAPGEPNELPAAPSCLLCHPGGF